MALLAANLYFDQANRVFPPTPDNFVWFTAQSLRPGEYVSLVYHDPKYDEVPWGIRWFDLKDRYRGISDAELSGPVAQNVLRQSSIVAVDAREKNPPLDQTKRLLPGWSMEVERDAQGAPVLWMFKPPEGKPPFE